MGRLFLLVVGVTCGWHLSAARADLPPLIPRNVLFGNPDKTGPQISPDGTRLAYLAPDRGVMNVWVRTLGAKDDHAVTHDRDRGIRAYVWAKNDRHILYIQDKAGDENWHLYAVDLVTNEERDLTPFDNVQAGIVDIAAKYPDRILVSLNRTTPDRHDLYQLNIETGELTLVLENHDGFMGYIADHNVTVAAAVRSRADGGIDLFVRDGAGAPWRLLYSWGPVDLLSSGSLGFTPDNQGLYIQSSTNADTVELRQIDIATGKGETLAGDSHADLADVVLHPTKHTVQAVGFIRERMVWNVLDETVKEDFGVIKRLHRGSFSIINRDRADRTWLVAINTDLGPLRYYAYDRTTKTGTLLFTDRVALEQAIFAQMEPIRFQSRDGLVLNAYLTTPRGVVAKNLPMVLLVHDGPWSRDEWGYDGEAQWLANRGYAVLQVNYRGSLGYGKDFANAANRDWGGAMLNDLLDGLAWAVTKRIADPARVGIMGSGFGGYAALQSLATAPDMFACAISNDAPLDLRSYVQNIIGDRKSIESIIWDRIGHPQRDADLLWSRSPRKHTDKIVKPLLLAHGANHPRIPIAEAQEMADALRDAGRDVEFVGYADEGSGFAVPENRIDFYNRAEKFLAEHLGGRYEPEETPAIKAKPTAPPDGT